MDRDHWSRVAREWTAWARKPDHDAFWAYRGAFVEFVGRGEGDALDVGCGEGRISRELTACGYSVTACDPVIELVDAARQAGSASRYVIASAEDLPFSNCSFDIIIAYNVLMNVEDTPAVMHEIARVLKPSGTVIISIVHPMADQGRFAGEGPDKSLILSGSYFRHRRSEKTEERDGMQMHFASWSRPLVAYFAALEQSGLAVTSLREPLPSLRSGQDDLQRWLNFPLFLWFKARPISG